MHFLIDGHNLIGKLPDLSLSDPQDEVELIMRLRGWVRAARNRQVTVFFDGGGLGGYSHRMSSQDIRVVFAPQGRQADDLLIDQLRGLRNPRNYTLVSSDRRIIDAAVIARIKVLKSEEFIQREGFDHREQQSDTAVAPPSPPEPPPGKELDPRLSESELKAWLELFGPVPERQPQPKPEAKKRVVRKRKKPGKLATPNNRENPELAAEDLDAWLALFGGERQLPTKDTAGKKRPSSPEKKKSKKKETADENPHGLSEEDLKAWKSYFGED